MKISKKRGLWKSKRQSPISTVFSIVRFPGCAKTVLSGDPLYKNFHKILNCAGRGACIYHVGSTYHLPCISKIYLRQHEALPTVVPKPMKYINPIVHAIALGSTEGGAECQDDETGGTHWNSWTFRHPRIELRDKCLKWIGN